MRRWQGVWDTMKHGLGCKHQSSQHSVPGEAEMHDVIMRVTVEQEGKNLQNITGCNKTPKHAFNHMYASVHPSVWGDRCVMTDVIIIVPNLYSTIS